MPKELIDEKFNKMLWRFNTMETIDAQLEAKLKIAFNEGVITGLEHFIEKMKPHMKDLKDLLTID